MKFTVSIKKEYYGTDYTSELRYPSIASAIQWIEELYKDKQVKKSEIVFTNGIISHTITRPSWVSGEGSFNEIRVLLEVLADLEREVDRKEYR
jgi:hypothetical protein